MKKTNVDLIVGGSIIIALLILIAGVLWLKEVSVSRKLVAYTVLFSNVGTLQEGDPLTVNGVNKGTVRTIRLRDEKVAVVIDVDKDVNLTDSCRVTVMNIGLMGERGIGVQLSAHGSIYKPSKGRDTTFIYGYFDSGIAEAMGMLGTVLAEVETLAVNVTDIVESTVGDTAFLQLFHTMVARLDTLTDVAERLVVKNEPVLERSIQDLSSITADLKQLLDKNKGHIDAIAANGETLTDYAISVAARVDTLTVTVKTMLDKVDRGEGSIGKLMQDEEFYTDLKRTMRDLDTLVNEVQDDALKLRVRLGFGKKKKERL